jgi:hypothetical protein
LILFIFGVFFSCNFETDLCRFTNLFNAELQFERTRAFQLVNDYAPERDHTLNNIAGSFVYVNTLDKPPNRVAQLRSTRFVPSNGCKVRFYYYMNSETNPGLLSFLVRNTSAGATTFIWSTSKILGHHWERQELLLPTGSLFELLIEVQSLGGGGFIALDDLSFSSQCNNSNGFLPFGTTARPNGTTPAPSTCTYTCNDGICVGKEKVNDSFYLLK